MRESVPKPQQLIPILKQLHEGASSPTGKFGFPVTTYKGYFPLQCSWCDSWEEFFSRQFRAELAWEAGIRGANLELEQLTEELFAKVIPRLLRPLQTGGRTIKPTLCHGDLWQGNVEIDVSTHQPILYDSCAVYAHNEFDLSLFRAPRYLLNKSHVDEYRKEVGVSEPIDDFDDRNALYALRNDMVVSALWNSRTVELRAKSIEEMKRLIAKFPQGINNCDG
ncbi:MAG: hypothetical protein MMC33_001598 [Icmadophila ericetorum]|nr:hypothetical protein [Icmadophila ericetorum]